MTKITAQQAFETAVNGLYAQGQLSTNSVNDCLYRSPEGLKCGVGFLIPDEVYQEGFEDQSASDIFGVPAIKELFDPKVTETFLESIQRDLHDQFVFATYHKGLPYKEWLINRAKDFARIHNLTLPKVIAGETS